MDRISHPVEHCLELAGDRVDIIRGSQHYAICDQHILQQHREIIVMDAFAFRIAAPAGCAVLDLQDAEIDEGNIRPGLTCSLKSSYNQPPCLALPPFRTCIDTYNVQGTITQVSGVFLKG